MSAPTPPHLDFKQQAPRLLSSFMEALRQERFKQALQTAQDILAVDPGNQSVLPFVPVLEEKIALDEDSDSEDEGDSQDGEAAGDDVTQQASDCRQAQGQGDEESSEDESSDDSDSSSSEEEDEADEGQPEQGGTELVAAYPPDDTRPRLAQADMQDVTDTTQREAAPASAPTRIALDPSSSSLTSAQRKALRASLARSIAELRVKEVEQQLKASEPLLGP